MLSQRSIKTQHERTIHYLQPRQSLSWQQRAATWLQKHRVTLLKIYVVILLFLILFAVKMCSEVNYQRFLSYESPYIQLIQEKKALNQNPKALFASNKVNEIDIQSQPIRNHKINNQPQPIKNHYKIKTQLQPIKNHHKSLKTRPLPRLITNYYKSIQKVNDPFTAKWNWRDCNDTVHMNRSEELYQQLIAVNQVFEKHNVEYILGFGTLIGVMRDNGMNPFEVDNDIVLLNPKIRRKLPVEIIQGLYKKGFIIFHSGIWRVCRKRDHGHRSNKAPWDGHVMYFPYTDVYPRSFANKQDRHFFGRHWDGKVDMAKVGDYMMPVPTVEFADRWLSHKYNNRWKEPPRKLKKHGIELK